MILYIYVRTYNWNQYLCSVLLRPKSAHTHTKWQMAIIRTAINVVTPPSLQGLGRYTEAQQADAIGMFLFSRRSGLKLTGIHQQYHW